MCNPNSSAGFFDALAVPTPPCYIELLNCDVLLRIFEVVVNSKEAREDAPVHLSKVSATWRYLIINTPTLWTQIRVHELLRATQNHKKFRRTIRRVKYFLGRSEQCPLSLDIVIQASHLHTSDLYHSDHHFKAYVSNFRGCIQQLSRMLGLHAARFAEFRLTADEFTFVTDVEKYLQRVPMPLLTYWRVALNASHIVLDPHPLEYTQLPSLSPLLRPDDAAADWGTHMFPNLRRVRLISVRLDWAHFGPTNLTSLSLCLLPNSARPTAPALRALLLASAPTLRIIDLDGCVRTDTPDAPFTPCTLPHVHTLTLGYRVAHELAPLLTHLRLPRLRSLALTDHHQRLRHRPRPSGLPALVRFDRTVTALLRALTACLPLTQLTHLALHHMRFLPPTPRELAALAGQFVSVRNVHGAHIPAPLFAFLAALTSLHTLELTGPDHTLLAALNYAPPAPSPCPGDPQDAEAGVDPGARPVPRLETLRLSTFNIFVVRNYLAFRHMSAGPPLAALELGMPAAWRGSPLLLLADKVARATVVVPITLRPVVEAFLLREVGFA